MMLDITVVIIIIIAIVLALSAEVHISYTISETTNDPETIKPDQTKTTSNHH